MNSVISKDIEEPKLDMKSFKPNAFLENSFFNAFFRKATQNYFNCI